MHEFVHFTRNEIVRKTYGVGAEKEEGKPMLNLCPIFVQFVWLTSYLLTSLFSAQIIYSVNQF